MKSGVFQCEDCEHIDTEADFNAPVYQCGCGETFRGEDGNRCPECNKFAAKISEHGCPECETGVGEEMEVGTFLDCGNCGCPNELEAADCRNCGAIFDEEKMAKKLTKKQEAEAYRLKLEEERRAEEADVIEVEWNGQAVTIKRKDYERMVKEISTFQDAAKTLYESSLKFTPEKLLVLGYQGWDVNGFHLNNVCQSYFSGNHATFKDLPE